MISKYFWRIFILLKKVVEICLFLVKVRYLPAKPFIFFALTLSKFSVSNIVVNFAFNAFCLGVSLIAVEICRPKKLVEIRPEKYEGKNSTMLVNFLYLSLIKLHLFRENAEHYWYGTSRLCREAPHPPGSRRKKTQKKCKEIDRNCNFIETN